MSKTTIELENMEFYAFHGHYEEEQRVGNRFRVDLSFEVDGAEAAQTDELGDTVSYLDVYECVREQMEVKSHLLEHVARRIVDALHERFPAISALRLKVSKMAPPLGGQVEKVSVIISE
ncbi:dihydroneopterin aldolase [uncultured Rikenella sp.]|uniref:dihydroneopterin aldolase n=1 Tax=uncultured Rikenella sp. TaxID=368003 RepID=UPI002638EBFA|nr:dihydroneopterin aldolase [uncultured Rikenella sp.]